MNTSAGTLEKPNGKGKGKRQLRGKIREREWKGAKGDIKTCWQADFGQVNGRRVIKSFHIKEDAENWLRQQRLLLADQGHAAFSMTDARRMDAIRALEILSRFKDLPRSSVLEAVAKTYEDCRGLLVKSNASIPDAVRYYVKMRPPEVEKQRTVADAVRDYVVDAGSRGLRKTTLKDMRFHLDGFVKTHGHMLVTEITRETAQNFIAGIKGAPATKRLYRRYCHGLFSFCEDRELVPEGQNPFRQRRGQGKLRQDGKVPAFFAVADVQKMMRFAEQEVPEMVPALALGFFAGLRTTELRQIEWSAVKFDQKIVTVSPSIAKSRSVRNVEMSDGLIAWLLPYRKESGCIAPQDRAWWTAQEAIARRSGAKWIKNGMRHSFATYHVAKYGNPAKTSYELGHNSPELLFRHYRGLATAQDAAKFWQIAPGQEGQLIQLSVPA